MTLCFLIVFSLLVGQTYGAHAAHAEDLRKEYPYGLLGDDYGILTKDDMAMNTCTAFPSPFGTEPRASDYWRCFNRAIISTRCQKFGYDSSEKKTLYLGRIDVREKGKKYTYGFRKLFSIDGCNDYLSDVRRLLKKKDDVVCLSGEFIDYGSYDSTDNSNHNLESWIFDKLKTKHGCTAYFGDAECSVRYWQEDGCEEIVKKYGPYLQKKNPHK